MPARGYVFNGWFGDIATADQTTIVRVDEDIVVEADFRRIVSVDVQTEGRGRLETIPRKTTGLLEGSTVTLFATPDPGWSFAGWFGDVSSYLPVFSFLASGQTAVTARFVPGERYAAWLTRHGLTGALSQPLADADGDGSVNLVEFGAGTRPGEPAYRPKISVRTTSDGSGQIVVSAQLSTSALGVDAALEFNDGGGGWQKVDSSSNPGVIVGIDANTRTVEWRFAPSSDEPALLWRLRFQSSQL